MLLRHQQRLLVAPTIVALPFQILWLITVPSWDAQSSAGGSFRC